MRRLREFIQAWFRETCAPAARVLSGAGLRPNHITLIGFLVSVAGAALVALEFLLAGGIVFALGSLCDMLDGLLARQDDASTAFGAFLDSTLDRIAEGIMFAAIAFHAARIDQPWLAGFTVLALVAAFLTSYTRARAEGLGVSCSWGLITRMERIFILCAGLILGLMGPAIWILLLLGGFTVVQRVVLVRRRLRPV